MRAMILLVAASCALGACLAEGALAQTAPAPQPPGTAQPVPSGAAPAAEPVTTGSPRPGARPATAPSQPGGIYARPGRCRELAIKRNLYGLARQRFIKRCRIARRSMPRPAPAAPSPSQPAPAKPPG
ncbi:hypothetical protein [Enterovirga aerilata]|uniref:Uncharacterized protein n=1 Tax=Enterovirga aerilata TaxID=2730920 RepID=A0A849I4U0_9HYPH|nr:hypothetical protein [Enterovirga sp. DB1703]NNM74856.1 hypothetical protein [Enterovirga sp. DB1703]